MKVQISQAMANHLGSKSCVAQRDLWSEALTGETGRPAIESQNHSVGHTHDVAMNHDQFALDLNGVEQWLKHVNLMDIFAVKSFETLG